MTELREIFLHELQDLYSAESQLITALPKMKAASASPALAEAFETHLQQTKEQKSRLQQIGKLLGESLSGEKCKAMQGLIEEGQGIVEEFELSTARDAALIAAAQRVEHYEISAYGSAKALAESLGHQDVVALLEATLTEEKNTDLLLTDLCESEIIPAAMAQERDPEVEGPEPTLENLESMTKEELYKLATERDLEGRSKMNKDELVQALA